MSKFLRNIASSNFKSHSLTLTPTLRDISATCKAVLYQGCRSKLPHKVSGTEAIVYTFLMIFPDHLRSFTLLDKLIT